MSYIRKDGGDIIHIVLSPLRRLARGGSRRGPSAGALCTHAAPPPPSPLSGSAADAGGVAAARAHGAALATWRSFANSCARFCRTLLRQAAQVWRRFLWRSECMSWRW
eukprot:jgi/Mesen1/7743/ME000407S06964